MPVEFDNGLRMLMFIVCTAACVLSIASCGGKKVVHNTIYTDDPEVIEIKKEYANILHIPKDSVKSISLYLNIEKWLAVRDSSISKLGSLNINFIQYLYFFNRKMRLPTSLEKLYVARKTYLFKNSDFLKEGDLVFFKENDRAVKEVGFYLENNIFVAADAGGNLNFYHLKDSITKFKLISNARIVRDDK